MGSSSVTGLETIGFFDNMSFDGTRRGGAMTTDGQLWVGSSVAPHIRLSSLTAGSGVTITPGNGTISISATGSGGTVTAVSVASANGFAGSSNGGSSPTLTLSTTITGVLSGNGTAITGSSITQYDVLVGGASNAISSVGPGTALQILQSGGNAANPAYSTATYPATTTLNSILYSSSANVVGQVPVVVDGVMISSHATGIPSFLANGTAGFVLTAQSGAPPAWVANASVLWTVITANQTAAVNNGYVCNKASTLALALPATASIGDIIEVTGINTATGWQITQAANQQIFFGISSTTLGATGTLTSSQIRDSVKLVCVVAGASTVWNVISSIGSPTIV